VRYLDDLLRPTLGGAGRGAVRIYSATTGYLASFFGGPVGGVIVAMVNSWRMGRIKKDLPLVAGALLVEGLLQLWLVQGGLVWLVSMLGDAGPAITSRIVGLMFFGGIYLVHKRYFRGAEVFGLNAPSGWLVGLLAIVAGIVVRLAIQAWVAK
jgi:hypothetical protein